jgi:hypothetical protein
MCTRARPYERAGWCGFGGRGVTETQIILQTDQEQRLFQQLKDREFVHTKVYDNALLNETGMIGEFGAAFDAIGWETFGMHGKRAQNSSP